MIARADIACPYCGDKVTREFMGVDVDSDNLQSVHCLSKECNQPFAITVTYTMVVRKFKLTEVKPAQDK